MNRAKAQAEIRRLAADRGTLRFTKHALVRNPKNNKFPISELQAAQCLQNGILKEDPARDIKLTDGWKFTMGRKAEEIETVVAGVLVPQTMILVITGYEVRLSIPRPPRPPPPVVAARSPGGDAGKGGAGKGNDAKGGAGNGKK